MIGQMAIAIALLGFNNQLSPSLSLLPFTTPSIDIETDTNFCMFALFTESRENGQMVPKVVAINHHQTI